MKVTLDESETEALSLFLRTYWIAAQIDYTVAAGKLKINHIFHDMQVLDKALGRPNLGKTSKKRRRKA